MRSKVFLSSNGWFSMKLPDEWEEYEDDNEGTYAFFNTKSWSGNLRITPLRISNADNNMVVEFLKSELEKNEGALQINIEKHTIVSFKTYSTQNAKEFVIYY